MALSLTKIALPDGHLDYLALCSSLADYANPRDKISRLISNGSLIRIKKGLYVLGESIRNTPLQVEVLANLMYGPSYISLQYALYHYGMIPERVIQITSVTTQKNKLFDTPVGRFSFKHLNMSQYAIGMRFEIINETTHYLIATPEKAVCDLVASVNAIKSGSAMRAFLLDDMRLNPSELIKLSKKSLIQIAKHYQNGNVDLLPDALKDLK